MPCGLQSEMCDASLQHWATLTFRMMYWISLQTVSAGVLGSKSYLIHSKVLLDLMALAIQEESRAIPSTPPPQASNHHGSHNRPSERVAWHRASPPAADKLPRSHYQDISAPSTRIEQGIDASFSENSPHLQGAIMTKTKGHPACHTQLGPASRSPSTPTLATTQAVRTPCNTMQHHSRCNARRKSEHKWRLLRACSIR
jgi:hypothetical protein